MLIERMITSGHVVSVNRTRLVNNSLHVIIYVTHYLFIFN